MAVGLSPPEPLPPIAGLELASGASGKRKSNDLALIKLPDGSRVSAVFTQNACRAAPVEIALEHLRRSAPKALLINSGNANAGTGQAGHQDALVLCRSLAESLAIASEQVLPFSTGVIGERLDMGALIPAVQALPHNLSADGWLMAAQAMMTTDTLPKGASAEFGFQGRTCRINGIAKGAAMMEPNMATVLCFMATDAAISQSMLDQLLKQAVSKSFNRITVEGDTSTNDACVLISTGSPASAELTRGDQESFCNALEEVALRLAQAIIRDAEGATRFITVSLEDGCSEADCLKVAYAIARSPLVKIVAFSGDPNWGRILMAAGNAGVKIAMDRMSIFLDDHCCFERGEIAENYSETQAASIMDQPEFTIRVSLGQGKASAQIWTSDLSDEYLRINSDYRT